MLFYRQNKLNTSLPFTKKGRKCHRIVEKWIKKYLREIKRDNFWSSWKEAVLARKVKSNSLNSATNLLHVSQMPDKIFLWHWNSDSNFTKRKNAEKNEVSFCSASERAILDLMHRQSIFCTIQMQALQKGSYAKNLFVLLNKIFSDFQKCRCAIKAIILRTTKMQTLEG